MKFTVDTKAKTITLIDRVTFKEMDSLKKFIGDNWREWSVEALKVTEVQKEYIYNNWWNYWFGYPHNPNPILYCGSGYNNTGTSVYNDKTPFTLTSSAGVNCLSSPDRSNFMVSADGALGSLTLENLLNQSKGIEVIARP